jgi:hypothetical protein
MNALKAVVVIMGILILAGSTVVVVTIYNRLTAPKADGGSTEPAATAAVEAFGRRELDVPAGSRIVSTTFGDGRLFLQIRRPDGGDSVVVVDPRTGAILGDLRVPASP